MTTTAIKKAFTEMIAQNKGIIYKVSSSYCSKKADREDLAQEIILNLWKSFPRFEEVYKFSTWMYRIALNVAISYYRRETRTVIHAPFDESLVIFDEVSEEDENVSLLFRFIGELREMDRSVILLYLEDKGYREIAEITGITETNVATKISRIKQILKNSFLNNQK